MSTAGSADVPVERQARYVKLMRLSKTVKVDEKVGRDLLLASMNLLEVHTPDDSSPMEEIVMAFNSFMPTYAEIFHDDFLKRPAFPFYLLKQVAEFYGNMHESTKASLPSDVAEGSAMMWILWLAATFDPQEDSLKKVYELVKSVRGMKITPTRPTDDDEIAVEEMRNVRALPQHFQERSRSDQSQDPRSGSQAGDSGTHPGQNQEQAPLLGKADMTEKLSAVNSEFRDKTFTGDLDQPMRQTVRDFALCARQLGLITTKKRDLFINCFAGNARSFFFDNCKDHMSFDELAKTMIHEYDSDARRLAVQSELEMMTLSRVMLNHDITDEGDALNKIVYRINILTPQCPPEFRSESNKIRFLRSAVLDRA